MGDREHNLEQIRRIREQLLPSALNDRPRPAMPPVPQQLAPDEEREMLRSLIAALERRLEQYREQLAALESTTDSSHDQHPPR
jgi:hypothetical protein